ncbi:MAG: glutathione peroxidase [Proteobacteria bacterium]|nr:glutathione peroxidase [Pseudomonadota bacterium]
MSTPLYQVAVRSIEGRVTTLEEHRGKVLLIVNTASRCGFTPQYAGLQELQDAYADRGFSVLGFPCNQFGAQEPGDEAEIADFCTTRFSVSFPMYAKLEVNGPNTHPLYAWLKAQKGGVLGSRIKWNFTKFLVDRRGNVVERFAPINEPSKIRKHIENLL